MKGNNTASLRQLMRSARAQKKQQHDKKKVESPLVRYLSPLQKDWRVYHRGDLSFHGDAGDRYNAVGQPVCRVCEVAVKDEALWEAHLACRQHKLVRR